MKKVWLIQVLSRFRGCPLPDSRQGKYTIIYWFDNLTNVTDPDCDFNFILLQILVRIFCYLNHENPSRIAEIRRIYVQRKSILRPPIQQQQHEVLH